MWTERMRQDWQHTSAILSMLFNVNSTSKSKQKSPDDMNPMERGSKSGGIPLNSEEGFQALASVAGKWRGP